MMININQLNTLKATAFLALAFFLALMPFSVKAYATTNGSYTTGGYPTTNSSYSTSGSSNSNSGNGSTNSGPTSRPTVSTEAATGIDYTKATIQGAVHVSSGTASAWFEWGTRVDSLTATTRTQIVTATSSGITETLTNLSEGATYYYRVAARNERGISYGAVKSVTTLSKSGNTSSSVSSTSGTISSSNGTISGGLSASAANAAADSGFTPTTFLGWLMIVVLIFAIVVVIRMIQRDMEAKKKAKEEEEKLPEPPRMKFA